MDPKELGGDARFKGLLTSLVASEPRVAAGRARLQAAQAALAATAEAAAVAEAEAALAATLEQQRATQQELDKYLQQKVGEKPLVVNLSTGKQLQWKESVQMKSLTLRYLKTQLPPETVEAVWKNRERVVAWRSTLVESGGGDGGDQRKSAGANSLSSPTRSAK